MKKFTFYLTEAEQINIDISLKDDIMDMIKQSLNTSDSKTVEDFILAFKTEPDKNQIEGLINDADIYDFYLKYQDDIDKILSDGDFYKKSPSELNIYSLYSYIIIGTKEAVNLIINNINSQTQTNSDF